MRSGSLVLTSISRYSMLSAAPSSPYRVKQSVLSLKPQTATQYVAGLDALLFAFACIRCTRICWETVRSNQLSAGSVRVRCSANM